MRCVPLLLVMCLLVADPVGHAQDLPIIPVFVVQPEAEFEDQALKDRRDSTRDLIVSLRTKRRTLRLVDDPGEAAVVTEVLDRAIDSDRTTSRLVRAPNGQIAAQVDQFRTVLVQLSVGDYVTEIDGRSAQDSVNRFTTWTAAASRAAAQIDTWIKDNRQRLTTQPGVP